MNINIQYFKTINLILVTLLITNQSYKYKYFSALAVWGSMLWPGGVCPCGQEPDSGLDP